MHLTLNQLLLLILTFAAVILVTFLVSLLIQLRKTARKASVAIEEFGQLANRLSQTAARVEGKLEDVDSLIETAKKAADGLSEVTWFATTKLIRPSSKFWPYIFPIIKLGWKQMHRQNQKKED